MAKIIPENGDIASSGPYDRYVDAQVYAWKFKDEPVSIVITQIDEHGTDIMDHWLKRLKAHAPILDVPLHPIARVADK